MPIRPENLPRYPADWPEVRARIQKRAGDHCERCGVKNWALGGRTSDGIFHPAQPIGELSLALVWPKAGERGWCGRGGLEHFLRIIRIVCTTAHVDQVIENCSDSNLLFLCQRCHLAHDQKQHAETRYATQREGKAASDLFDGEVSPA